MRPRLTAALLALGLLLCSAPAPGQDAGEKKADMQALARAQAGFAADLYARISRSPGNLFLSPYSVSTALAMTHAGAKGETAAEMARVLRFPFRGEKLHRVQGALVHSLNHRTRERRWRDDPDAGKKAFELVTANRLWPQKGYPFEDAFLALTGRRYGAQAQPLDYRSDAEAARKTINAWVEKQTRDKIQDLIGPGQLTADVRMVLTNAIYFKAAWAEPFQERATRPAAFRLDAERTVQVPFLHRTGTYPTAETETYRAVALPYTGGELLFVAVAPREPDGLPAVEALLDQDFFASLLESLEHRRLALALPKFRVKFRCELSGHLRAMGMERAFSYPGADFTGISPTGELFLSRVIHQSFVDVNEAGTEAAAATAVVMRAGSAPREPQPFALDRPFLFCLLDSRTGSVLFLGRVADPSSND